MKKRALIAMSGGVDSTVAAWMMKQQGWDLTAINLLMLPGAETDSTLIECCKKMDIPLIVRNCIENFHHNVLLPGAREYASGRTPNPCCECNAALKFREIFNVADELGIETVVTGHYAAISISDTGVARLGLAKDRNKDQSYFLYRLPQQELKRCCFPLGGSLKSEVRALAAQAGLVCASRPDSQDACFQIPGECCGDTLSRLCRLCGKRGRFIYQGKTVGKHEGIHRYTIGQRQGLGVALGVPAYVKAINPVKGDIILCTDQNELMCDKFIVNRTVWQSVALPAQDEVLTVKVRYRSASVECRCISTGEANAMVLLSSAQRAVTPGQAAVFYDQSGFLLGGGVISLAADSHLENSQPQ